MKKSTFVCQAEILNDARAILIIIYVENRQDCVDEKLRGLLADIIR